MPERLEPDRELLAEAVYAQRWTALARAGTDLATIATWDRRLPRRDRILVPVDVQAFVVPAAGAEATVPVTGVPGGPGPFAEPELRDTGVHLHWAMPDALLRGRADETGAALALPRLPDRWVVVRALFPEGRRRVLLRGWVVDAPSGSVTSLSTYAGTPDPAPEGTPVLAPLDGGVGGSLLWTATYEAARGRFGFHDPLDDLDALADVAPDGFHAEHAVYTVAGWWSDEDADPLNGLAGTTRLDAKLAELGWAVVHDGDDDVLAPADPRLARLQAQLGVGGSGTPTSVEIATRGRTERYRYADVVPQAGVPVEASTVLIGPALPTYETMLHGSVTGVPIDGDTHGWDDLPDRGSVGVAAGLDIDDVTAAFGAEALGLSGDGRLAAERLVAAFTGDLLDRLGSPDGIPELEEREHGDGFWSFAGPPLPASRPDRLRAEDSAAVNPVTVGRKGRGELAGPYDRLAAKVGWKRGVEQLGEKQSRRTTERTDEKARERPAVGETREVPRAAPRLFRPQPPLVALRGVKPHHRHHGDGMYDDRGRLRCRYPRECVPGLDGVVSGAAVLPTLGSGAVPDEVLRVVREAVVLDPYAYRWLAAAGSEDDAVVGLATNRLAAEMLRLYGPDGRYDGSGLHGLVDSLPAGPRAAPGDPWAAVSGSARRTARQAAAEIGRYSLAHGTPPSPVAITAWRQPWVPLWLEWRVALTGGRSVSGWELGSTDLDPAAADAPETAPEVTMELTGRSPLGRGAGTALREGIRRWLEAEQQRDLTPGASQLSDADEAALADLGDTLVPLDVVSASLDGVREQLLGIPYVGQVERGPAGPDGSEPPPRATGAPVPLFHGTLRLAELRVVDAFGRVLDVPLTQVRTTVSLEVPAVPTGIRLRPRLQHAARWLFRLTDPGHPAEADPAAAREAFVDQHRPELAVNPVAGFLLPDHVDEALEVFDVGGAAMGQLGHDPVSGAVTWEPAPGRPLPPDAGPLAGMNPSTLPVGRFAAGVAQADVEARAAEAPPDDSALTALLRAVDTTLWSVDSFGAIGSPSVAGLVGRPVAVVTATLRLDAPDDVDELDVVAPGGPDARREAFAALADERFPVRLGELTRSDDALLGFYVDDDYLHLHLVDKVVASGALESGRHRGHLGLLGATPGVAPLSHPFLLPDSTLWVRPGQVVRLTLLMLPAGKVHLTSGVLPRKSLALGDDWVTPGLSRLVPSLRVGPVLVDPAEIRLPLVHVLGERQTFTRRTGPLTWRDDPIVAATQSALLPRMPHEAQEGWVRVTPDPGEEPGGGPR